MNLPQDFLLTACETPEASPSVPTQAERTVGLLKTARLLVVDDSKMMRMAITRALRLLGVEHIEEASNGKEALQRLEGTAFDLMLLDIEMPEMTGMEVLTYMQACPRLRSFPVIVISGGQEIDDAVRCIELGAEDYLPKPFSPVLLKARLTSSIEKKRLRDIEREQRQRLEEQHEQLEQEKQKTDNLLLNILPRSITKRLKGGEQRIADAHQEVSVLFADLVGFTKMSQHMAAQGLVNMLDDIFSRFDRIVAGLGIEKIKTIGDCYMLVSGVPDAREDHARAVVEAGFCMLEAIDSFNHAHGTQLQIRIGVHSGSVIAGVIGRHKFTYDLWGHTVNVASRMESTGVPGRIHISSSTAQHIDRQFVMQARGLVTVKGIGELQTFFVLGHNEN